MGRGLVQRCVRQTPKTRRPAVCATEFLNLDVPRPNRQSKNSTCVQWNIADSKLVTTLSCSQSSRASHFSFHYIRVYKTFIGIAHRRRRQARLHSRQSSALYQGTHASNDGPSSTISSHCCSDVWKPGEYSLCSISRGRGSQTPHNQCRPTLHPRRPSPWTLRIFPSGVDLCCIILQAQNSPALAFRPAGSSLPTVLGLASYSMPSTPVSFSAFMSSLHV